MERKANLFSGLTTALLVVCAVTMTGIMVRRELFGSGRTRDRFEKQRDWQEYAGVGHRLGSPTATVVLVEFADFQCPSCRTLAQRLDATMKRFPSEFAIEFRHYPLDIHPHAMGAALASECAAEQGMFAAMHDNLFRMKDSIGVVAWTRLAEMSGLPERQRFERCMIDSIPIARIRRDRDAAEQLGARGTPTAMVNGVRFTGALPQAVLDSLVGAAIATAMKGK